MTTKTDNHAEEQAQAQYQSICAMLDAVEVDYERLQELRDEREELSSAVTEAENIHEAEENAQSLDAFKAALEALAQWDEENAEDLNTLEHEAGDCEDEDDARQRISEDPLEVTVRSGWVSMGEEMEADEFQILLCTGGPAVRIMGELDHHGTPCRAWMEYQDWGTPWTQYFGAEHARLIAYAQHFFG
jgi:hypothetical protein